MARSSWAARSAARAVLRPRLRGRHQPGGPPPRRARHRPRRRRVRHRLRADLGRVGQRIALPRAARPRGRAHPHGRLRPDGRPGPPGGVHRRRRRRHRRRVRHRLRGVPRRDDVALELRPPGGSTAIIASSWRRPAATCSGWPSPAGRSWSAPSYRPARLAVWAACVVAWVVGLLLGDAWRWSPTTAAADRIAGRAVRAVHDHRPRRADLRRRERPVGPGTGRQRSRSPG